MRISDWSSDVCSSDLALSFEVPDDLRDAYRFTPGQHLTLRCADGVRRSYSICSTPGSGELRIGIRQLPDGWFSRGVVPNLEPGGTLDVMTPEGRFTVDPVPETSQRSEEHTSELQSLMRISYAVFCLNKKKADKRHRIL